jgi:hypothetical protein
MVQCRPASARAIESLPEYAVKRKKSSHATPSAKHNPGYLHGIDFIIINSSNKHRNVSLSFFLWFFDTFSPPFLLS